MFDPLAVRSSRDLPGRLPVRLPAAAPLTFRFDEPVVYAVSWVREPCLGKLLGEAGRRVPSGVRLEHKVSVTADLVHEVSLDSAGQLRLRLGPPRAGAGFPPVAASTAQEAAEAPDAIQTLDAILSPLEIRDGAERARISRSILNHAVEAAASLRAAGLSGLIASAGPTDHLADCSFAFTGEGLALFRRALTGDYTWLGATLPAGCESRPALLTRPARQETAVELHLPFVNRKPQRAGPSALPAIKATGDGIGRVFVGPDEDSRRAAAHNATQAMLALSATRPGIPATAAEGFTLSHTDRRTLPRATAASMLAPLASAYGLPANLSGLLDGGSPDDAVDVELTLSIPGSMAAAWWDALDEPQAMFFPVYSRVSVAIQRAMRLWLPYVCFSDAARLELSNSAVPLAVYAASRPFQGKPKFELTQDLLGDSWASAFFLPVAQLLPRKLSLIRNWLAAAGHDETAARLAPENAPDILAAAVRRPRHVRAILASETYLVDAFVELGGACRRFRRSPAAASPAGNRRFSEIAGGFANTLNGRLRRMFAGIEFLGLGGLILIEATAALNRSLRRPSAIRAVLRIHDSSPEGEIRSTRILASARGPSPPAMAA